MTRRVRIINEFARALDVREGITKVPVHALRKGDVLSGTGETVVQVSRGARTPAGKSEVIIEKNGYRRLVLWGTHTQVGVTQRDPGAVTPDGVGSPEEVAYGEGWHSTENVNPYTSAVERVAWEKGRAAKKLKFRMNTASRRGEVRGHNFQPPKQRIADFKSEKGYVAKIIDVKTGGTLARSEPHISNGVGLKNWIREEATKLIRQGKRVRADINIEFFDPERV